MAAHGADVFVQATTGVTTLAGGGNPLLLLPTRDALVFLAKASGLQLASVARALGVSRETAYRDLRRVRTALETRSWSAGDGAAPGHQPWLRRFSAR